MMNGNSLRRMNRAYQYLTAYPAVAVLPDQFNQSVFAADG